MRASETDDWKRETLKLIDSHVEIQQEISERSTECCT